MKMPPVCSQREPLTAKIRCQSKSLGWLFAIAVLPRSEQPTAARTPKPRSVKFRPLRTVLPIPSYGTQRMSDVSTPPCRIRSSSNCPIGFFANAVMTVVRMPKHRLSPRATLYSPPPSQARKVRAVWMRSSPGSSRSMTSPRLMQSHLQPSGAFKMIESMAAF